MSKIPKEVGRFKILFIITTSCLLARVTFQPALLNFAKNNSSIIAIVSLIAAAIFIVFLWYLHYSAKILKLNNVIKIKPWILVVLQVILGGGPILPWIIIPLYIWIKSKKLLTLDTIKTYDEKKFMLPPK